MKNSNRYKTKLFTRGANREGNLGLPAEISETTQFTEVTQIQNQTPEESRHLLEIIDHVATGRSSIIFSTKNNRIFVCGMNNYNQLGIESTDSVFMFVSIEQLIFRELEKAREKELNALNLVLESVKASPTTANFLRERLNRKFGRVESIDFVDMGWFHSIVVINKNLIFGSGHSYFGQLFGLGFSPFHQYLEVDPYNYLSIIEKIENSSEYFDPFQENKVTHVSCGTFSTTVVFNERVVCSCGEVAPFKMEDSFKLKISDELENTRVSKVYHLDTGIAIYTANERIIMLENPENIKRFENVVKCVGGHLCNDLYFILKDSPNLLRRVYGEETPSYSLSNIHRPFHFLSGYYHLFCISQEKYIYTDASFVADNLFEEDNIENSENIQLSALIGPKSKVGDEGDELLAKLIICEQYNVHTISSGSDFSLILIYNQSSKEQEEMKHRLHKQSQQLTGNTLSDILVVSPDIQLY